MNYLARPPIKESFVGDEPRVGHPSAWLQWFGELAVLFNQSQLTGTTAQRPDPAPYIGFQMFDTTLGKPIWAKTQTPATWVDATGATA